jgi:hypothetical protein
MIINGKFEMNWINAGLSKNPAPYPSGVDLDVAHGAVPNCVVKYATRAGLNSIKCRACGANAIFDTTGRGAIKLACLSQQPTPQPVITPFRGRAI